MAKLAIRLASVTLCPPNTKPHLSTLQVQMVLAQEEDAPAGVEPIEWALLTTLAWYTQRWGIEVFPRSLKSGCRVEDRQLGHGERLQACLAIDRVLAWRILHI